MTTSPIYPISTCQYQLYEFSRPVSKFHLFSIIPGPGHLIPQFLGCPQLAPNDLQTSRRSLMCFALINHMQMAVAVRDTSNLYRGGVHPKVAALISGAVTGWRALGAPLPSRSVLPGATPRMALPAVIYSACRCRCRRHWCSYLFHPRRSPAPIPSLPSASLPRGSDLICRVLGLVCVVRTGSCLGLPLPAPPMMFARRSPPSLTPTTDVVREANLAEHDGEIVAKLQAPPCSTSRRITTIYMDWVVSLEPQTCDGRMR